MRSLPLFVAALLVGCAAQGPAYQTPAEPPTGYANLVIYRVPSGPGSAWGTDFHVDEKKVADLRIHGYTRVLIKDGEHVVRMGTLRVPVDAKTGTTYFVRYGSRIASIFMAGPTPIVQGSGLLTLVSPELAVRELVDYRYTEPEVQRVD
jgi:hypothetical protein